MNISQEEMSEFHLFMEKKAKAESLKQKREEKKKKEEEEKRILAEAITKRKETEDKKKRSEQEIKKNDEEQKSSNQEELRKKTVNPTEENKQEDCRLVLETKRRNQNHTECPIPEKVSSLDLTTEENFFPSYISSSEESTTSTPKPRKTPRPFLHVTIPARVATHPEPAHGFLPKAAAPRIPATSTPRLASTIVRAEEKPSDQTALITALTKLTDSQIEVAASMRDFARSMVGISRAIEHLIPQQQPRWDDRRERRDERRGNIQHH